MQNENDDEDERDEAEVEHDEAGTDVSAGVTRMCCGQAMRIDRDTRGTTVGGLAVVGGLACDVCGTREICNGITRVAESDESTWQLAAGGRSLDCGSVRVRAESRGKRPRKASTDAGAEAGPDPKTAIDPVVALMARLARVPQLEAFEAALPDAAAENTRLRAILGDLCDAFEAREIVPASSGRFASAINRAFVALGALTMTSVGAPTEGRSRK